jgi:hypothetical protein
MLHLELGYLDPGPFYIVLYSKINTQFQQEDTLHSSRERVGNKELLSYGSVVKSPEFKTVRLVDICCVCACIENY